MENEPQKTKGNGLGMILIVIVIIAIAAFFLKNDKVSVEPIPGEGINQIELENLDTMKDQLELSDVDDLNTIQSELDDTSFAELEADLNALSF